jgi:hypothetical protein
MRRSITPLLVVLLLQLVLAGALLARRDPLAGTRTDTPLLQADTTRNADEIVIEGKPPRGKADSETGAPPAEEPARIVLRKKDGIWVLPGAYDAPADAAKVTALVGRLTALKRGLPIATSDAALKRFRLIDSDFERRLVLSAGGKALATVYFGSSPGLRKSDARTALDRAVYAIDLPTYELPTESSAWLSTELLKSDSDKLAEIDVAGAGHEGFQLVRQKGSDKQPDRWNDPSLKGDQRIDSAQVESLAQQIAALHVDAVLGTAANPDWQQDHALLTLTLRDDRSQSAQWSLSKPNGGDFYVLKSSAHPWYFSVSTRVGKALIDASARDALIVASKPSPPPGGKS